MNFTTNTLTSAEPVAQKSITIDWSGELTAQNGSEDNITNMINWLKRYPNTRDVHVYVGNGSVKHSAIRLKRVLQSLGCKVTVRQQYVAN